MPTPRKPDVAFTATISAIVLTAVFVCGSYFLRQSGPHETVPVASATPPPPTSPQPAIPLAKAKPIITESEKTRILNLIEKASKLRVMTEQGTRYLDFKVQLSEVRGAWEALSTSGLPESLRNEQSLLNTAVSAWVLVQEIRSEQIVAETEVPRSLNSDLLFLIRARTLYNSKIAVLSEALRHASIQFEAFPNVSSEQSFRADVTKKLFELTGRMTQNISETRNSSDMEVITRRFKAVFAEINFATKQAFDKTALPSVLSILLDGPDSLPEIMRVIAEKEALLRFGPLAALKESLATIENGTQIMITSAHELTATGRKRATEKLEEIASVLQMNGFLETANYFNGQKERMPQLGKQELDRKDAERRQGYDFEIQLVKSSNSAMSAAVQSQINKAKIASSNADLQQQREIASATEKVVAIVNKEWNAKMQERQLISKQLSDLRGKLTTMESKLTGPNKEISQRIVPDTNLSLAQGASPAVAKWCLGAAAIALEAAKKGVSAHLTVEPRK